MPNCHLEMAITVAKAVSPGLLAGCLIAVQCHIPATGRRVPVGQFRYNSKAGNYSRHVNIYALWLRALLGFSAEGKIIHSPARGSALSERLPLNDFALARKGVPPSRYWFIKRVGSIQSREFVGFKNLILGKLVAHKVLTGAE